MPKITPASSKSKSVYAKHTSSSLPKVEAVLLDKVNGRELLIWENGSPYDLEEIEKIYARTPYKAVVTATRHEPAHEGHEIHSEFTYETNGDCFSFEEVFTCDWIHAHPNDVRRVEALVETIGGTITVHVDEQKNEGFTFGVWSPFIKGTFQEVLKQFAVESDPDKKEHLGNMMWDKINIIGLKDPTLGWKLVFPCASKLTTKTDFRDVMMALASALRNDSVKAEECIRLMLPGLEGVVIAL